MTGLQKLVKLLERDLDKITEISCISESNRIKGYLDCARLLLSQEREQTEGLVEEFKKCVDRHKTHWNSQWAINTMEEILSRYTPTESIAEKPLVMTSQVFWHDDEDGGGWAFTVRKGKEVIRRGCADTKEDAEAKARQYLNSLPDKEGR